MNINLIQIATIQSPFCNLENMPVQPRGAKDTYATIKFKEEYQEGLKDLKEFSHIYLIYYFHKVCKHELSVIPFNDETRTPVHPNQIGLSIVELVSVEKNIVTIKGINILDGTPLLDIKPYIENFDKIDGITRSGWMKNSTYDIEKKRSDNRFL